MIWMTDAAGQATYLCPEWYAFTGQAPAAGLGCGWTAAIHPDERSLIADAFLKACKLECEFVLQYRLRRHDGTYAWVTDAAAPSRLPGEGLFLGFLGMVRPIEGPIRGLVARAELQTFRAAPAAGEFAPASKLDMVAHHLLMARAAALGATDDLMLAFDALLFEVGRRLAQGMTDETGYLNVH
jgi:PAS domain S-box-containing protein